jgi:hypothetical protein
MQVRKSLENATKNAGRPSGQTPRSALRAGKTRASGILCSLIRSGPSLAGLHGIGERRVIDRQHSAKGDPQRMTINSPPAPIDENKARP